MNQVDASIIVVTYNSAAVVGSCLESLPTDARYQLIAIDNNSTDGTRDVVKRHRPDVILLENEGNEGFAAAVNRATTEAAGEFLLLINPDARITEETLVNLVGTARSMPDCAVISPLVTDERDTFRTIAAGHFPTLWRMFTHATGLSRLGSRLPTLQGHYLLRDQVDSASLRDVDWVSGGCVLIRTETWRATGGLTERWFMYAEDIEFCLRVRRRGERVVLDTRQRATHEIGGSSSGVDGRVGTLWLANLYDLYNWKMSPNKGASWAWRKIVTAGFHARAAVAKTRRHKGRVASQDYVRFRAYAQALRQAGS